MRASCTRGARLLRAPPRCAPRILRAHGTTLPTTSRRSGANSTRAARALALEDKTCGREQRKELQKVMRAHDVKKCSAPWHRRSSSGSEATLRSSDSIADTFIMLVSCAPVLRAAKSTPCAQAVRKLRACGSGRGAMAGWPVDSRRGAAAAGDHVPACGTRLAIEARAFNSARKGRAAESGEWRVIRPCFYVVYRFGRPSPV